MNKTIQSGNICSELKLETSKNGKNFCKFSIAATSNYKDKDGKQHVDFIDCIAWGAQAEYLKSYGLKGQKATIFGSIQTGSYEDKDGKKHKTTVVNVNEVELAYKATGKAKADDSDESIEPQEVDTDSLPF